MIFFKKIERLTLKFPVITQTISAKRAFSKRNNSIITINCKKNKKQKKGCYRPTPKRKRAIKYQEEKTKLEIENTYLDSRNKELTEHNKKLLDTHTGNYLKYKLSKYHLCVVL